MSNPSGTDHDDATGPAAASGGGRHALDSEPATEVIDVVGALGPAEPETGERRYTAPGFDAGFTQIIDRVPDAPTEFIGTAGEGFSPADSRPRTAPQAIAPRPGSRRRPKWLLPVILVVVAALAAGVVGLVLLQRNSAKNAREQMVRNTIKTFNTAVQAGDLATLRSITCGQNRESYVSYDDDVWADTYPRVMAAKQYPVVQSVDEVVVNGDRAEANVTSYMAFDPATTSSRSFDLQFLDEQWKICQSS
jgi:hypothetical protein